jgi:ATP-dependent phosphofructokinase / diphosphate-dependent phosphofructokinase
MISIQAGRLVPIPFEKILDTTTGKTAVRLVDMNSHQYRLACSAIRR